MTTHNPQILKQNKKTISYTLPETNITPENKPSQKESSLATIHFQVRTVSFREGTVNKFDWDSVPKVYHETLSHALGFNDWLVYRGSFCLIEIPIQSLVDGFNPSEKYACQISSSHQGSG